jgi:predicted nuclease of predicted toxin-antitoxin system
VTPLRLLADENVPRAAVQALVGSGLDIVSVAEVLPSVADEDVLAFAKRNGQILISFDKDFGRLVFLERLPSDGVVFLRVPTRSPEYVTRVLAELIRSEITLFSRFTVVSESRVRSIPLPPHRSR